MHHVHISTGFMLVLVILILGLAGLATYLLVAFMNRNKKPVEGKHTKHRKSNQSVFGLEDQEPVRIPTPPAPPAFVPSAPPTFYPTTSAQNIEARPRTTGYMQRLDSNSYSPSYYHASNNTSGVVAVEIVEVGATSASNP